VQGHTYSVLHESGNVGRLPCRYQGANFLDLIAVEGDGDLLSRHTNYHTTTASFQQGPVGKVTPRTFASEPPRGRH